MLHSLAEQFAMSEVAQGAVCCRPLQKALELHKQPDSAAHGTPPDICCVYNYDDCLEDKREDYQNCSALYCVSQLYTSICALISAVLTDKLGPVGLGCVSFCVFLCIILLLLLDC